MREKEPSGVPGPEGLKRCRFITALIEEQRHDEIDEFADVVPNYGCTDRLDKTRVLHTLTSNLANAGGWRNYTTLVRR